uniref:Uncharacterized protein n=1 Tax=Ditylenchus dipsaci TaxID=166011 RepID=A0A915DUX6_9BILA
MQLHLFIYFIISSLFVSGQNDSSPDQNLSAGSPKETIHNFGSHGQRTFFSGLIIIEIGRLGYLIKRPTHVCNRLEHFRCMYQSNTKTQTLCVYEVFLLSILLLLPVIFSGLCIAQPATAFCTGRQGNLCDPAVAIGQMVLVVLAMYVLLI